MGRLNTLHTAKAGYSLVEILVVLMIIGLMTSAAYLSFRPDRDPAHQAATTLQLDLARARSLAISQGRFIGVEVFADGYRFLTYDAGEWRRLDGVRQLDGRDFEDGQTLRLQGFAQSETLADTQGWPHYWFDPTGMNEAATFWVESAQARVRVEIGGLDGIRLIEAG